MLVSYIYLKKIVKIQFVTVKQKKYFLINLITQENYMMFYIKYFINHKNKI
ncbi:hypothetical protein CWS_02220 [Buchnera aphidicola str. JF99 (Acyrthosiphon pisum)]|nr:hypothetical protein CWS_02220 [Buchnera aphidicola str. JF99 (Acyrthosiphon pisum)]ADP67904.1 hypothetical protein CWU_02755 [Buchnera aphidicola str. JF98 (Acyrthosiphon pisum)]